MAAALPSIHTRVATAKYPASPSDTAQTAIFLTMVLDYTLHLRSVERPKDTQRLARENKTAQHFVALVVDDLLWPLVQQVAGEYRYPSEPAGKPWLLKDVLAQLEAQKPVPDVLLPADDIAEWQRDKFWDRIRLNLEYLTFAWSHETEASKRRLREGKDAYDRMMQVIANVYPAEDSDDSDEDAEGGAEGSENSTENEEDEESVSV
ncbi:hypothetical protein CLCR_07596 [Cladophialophora carrionii]|uniref:Uncharacterized protein n=1 Tax=Cladophialophora carrionii TaxID=86049 RepID=A0A1C1CM37_9EURO|nr:hypothetical protein CLCR_07596 [Cladophialophora carrionii]